MSGSVLLLDDDEELLDAVASLIEFITQAPCLRMRSLEEVQQARDRVLECRLAILDIALGAGGPSGLDVYRWLVHEGFPGQVVFLTGHASSHPLVKSAAEVANARVVQKPVGLEELRGVLAEGGT
jgi:FixJ family two-component response regulator